MVRGDVVLHFDVCGYFLSRSDRRLKEKDMMLEEEKNRAARAERAGDQDEHQG